MRNRLVIGIIASPSFDKNDNETISILDSYRRMIVDKCAIPLIIPPLQNIDYKNKKNSEIPELSLAEKNMYLKLLNMCDGLIIPGGNCIYNYMFYVIEEALKKDIPILGICMGMQALAIIDNNYSKCILKNETVINHYQKEVRYAHKININKDTRLYNIFEVEQVEVNSCHNYHITNLNKFIISSVSLDGIIESIELPGKKFVVGVQWHPEKMFEYDEVENKLIDAFMTACNLNEKILV